MNTFMKRALTMGLCLGSASLMAQTRSAGSASETPHTLTIVNGVASFSVATNIMAIEVSGKSTAVQARVTVRQEGGSMTLQHIEASLAAKSLNTGMGLRDEHMRKHIFTTAGGDVPDLRFEGGEVDCPAAAPGREIACKVSGSLAIRGVPKPFSIALKVRQTGDLVRASGDGIVKLSDYGIERPTQLGVKTSDDVKIHLDLSSKEAVSLSASTRREQ